MLKARFYNLGADFYVRLGELVAKYGGEVEFDDDEFRLSDEDEARLDETIRKYENGELKLISLDEFSRRLEARISEAS